MASPINPNQPSALNKTPLLDTAGYAGDLGTQSAQSTAQGVNLTELYNWYIQALDYYQQVQSGTVVEPDVAGLIDQLNYAYTTLSQSGYSMDTLGGGAGGAGGAGGLPQGAIMGAHDNYVYNEFGDKIINYTGGEAVATSDIWVGPGGSLNLNIAATSAEVTMEFVDDTRSNPPKKVLQIKVRDAATGDEHVYNVQDYENVNPENFFINTATGKINDKTGKNLATVGVYDGSSERAPEYEGSATVTQEGPNHFKYSVHWGDSITFYPRGGVDQTHEVFGPANIYVDPQAEVDVYLRQPSGYEVVVTNPDGTHDTFLLQEGYQFDIGAHESQVEWHVPMDPKPNIPTGPSDKVAATQDADDGDVIDDGGVGIAGPGNLAASAAESASTGDIKAEGQAPDVVQATLNLENVNLEEAFDLPEGWEPNDPDNGPLDEANPVDEPDGGDGVDPEDEPQAQDTKPASEPEVDPFDPYGGKPRETSSGFDIPPEFQQDFLFQGASAVNGDGGATQETPPSRVIDLAAMLGIDPLDIPHTSTDGKNFWDKIQAGVLPPDPDVLNIISYFDSDLRAYVDAYKNNPSSLTATQIRERLVGVLQMIYGDAVQGVDANGNTNGLKVYFKGENGKLVEYNVSIVERSYYGETYNGVSIKPPSPSTGGITVDEISSGQSGSEAGIPESFRELAMGVLFPGDNRSFDQLYNDEKKSVEQKAQSLMADFKSKTGHSGIPNPPDYKSMRWLMENDSSLKNQLALYSQVVGLYNNGEWPGGPLALNTASNQRKSFIIQRLNELFGGGFDTNIDFINDKMDQLKYKGQVIDFFDVSGYKKGEPPINGFSWDN
ncbi:MAG: hypothetical protein H7A32_00355 [Deltaproteobacteria bacterium]|nr:hypothetical protein [Deltaproteobacteria bacterium]